MWDYSEKVKEYYRNPKNVGEIEDANGVGEVGSISCGDALKLYIKVDENGIITDAKFQTFGCGSAVASSSILTEMVKGKTIDEAMKITNQDIANELGGLPPEKMHCSVMGMEALEAAIANYKGEKPPAEHEDDKIVCKCFGGTESKLRHVIQENKLKTIQEVSNFCKAGGGCGMCHDDIQKIIDEENSPKKEEPKLTKTQMIIKINKVLEDYVSHQLAKDGGGIELVEVDGNKVYVKLQGACKACQSSNMTLKNFVEKILRENISSDIEVIEA